MTSKQSIPKDASVIMSIMKDMGIVEYENRVINQLLEFTYRYVTCILDDSRVYANHAKKKGIDLDDVKLAISLNSERSFTTPPHRDLLLDIARTKNTIPLPLIKPHCGLRLPPDRYCLLSCNYKMLNAKKPQVNIVGRGAGFMGGMGKGMNKPSQLSLVKRPVPGGAMATIARTQSVTIPKPVIKFSPAVVPGQKMTTVVKPKIQIATGMPGVVGQTLIKVEPDTTNELKRKRDEDSFGER